MFCGDSEIDQIFKIFQFHGTPTPAQWMNIRIKLLIQTIFQTSNQLSLNSKAQTPRLTSKILIKLVWTYA